MHGADSPVLLEPEAVRVQAGDGVAPLAEHLDCVLVLEHTKRREVQDHGTVASWLDRDTEEEHAVAHGLQLCPLLGHRTFEVSDVVKDPASWHGDGEAGLIEQRKVDNDLVSTAGDVLIHVRTR